MRNEDIHPPTISPQKQSQISKITKWEVDDFDEKAIFLCQFCGGAACDQENYLKNKFQPNAVEGLHSNWITPNILAMQRPSERLIKQFHIYAKFKELNIRTVLNLQEPGQHPYCGDGIFPQVGFSYIPENFYHHGIHCFNESWEDMTATTFEQMMKIMNVFDMSLHGEGKISVHCHAGRGRTLMVICSWLIYHDRMKAQDTIELAISKRQGVLTRSSQRQFLIYFQEELRNRWNSFSVTSDHKSFSNFVGWQTAGLLNKQKKHLHGVPIIHYKLMQQLRRQLRTNFKDVVQALISPYKVEGDQKWKEAQQKQLEQLKRAYNLIDFTTIHKLEPHFVVELLFDFYQHLPYTLVTSLTVDCLMEELENQRTNQSIISVGETKIQGNKSSIQLSQIYLNTVLQPAIVHNLGVASLAVILDFLHFVGSINQTLLIQQSDSSHSIIESLYLRFAMLFLSKKKYFPQLFPANNHRKCKIFKHREKISKVVSEHVLFLASFLKQLGKQVPLKLQEVHRIVFKTCQVESNLFYFTKESGSRILGGEEKKQIYDSSRINFRVD